MKNTWKFTFASDGTVATTLLWSSGLQVFKVLASLSFAICSGQTFISPKPHFWLCAKTQCIIWSMWCSIFVTDQRAKKAHWHWHWFERPYSCPFLPARFARNMSLPCQFVLTLGFWPQQAIWKAITTKLKPFISTNAQLNVTWVGPFLTHSLKHKPNKSYSLKVGQKKARNSSVTGVIRE